MPFVSKLDETLGLEVLVKGKTKEQKYAEENDFVVDDRFDSLDIMGVYGIYSNGVLLYIGKSKCIGNRFLAHMKHIIENESEEDKEWKYTMLRYVKNSGYKISFRVIAQVFDESTLDDIERSLIWLNEPKLNKADIEKLYINGTDKFLIKEKDLMKYPGYSILKGYNEYFFH